MLQFCSKVINFQNHIYFNCSHVISQNRDIMSKQIQLHVYPLFPKQNRRCFNNRRSCANFLLFFCWCSLFIFYFYRHLHPVRICTIHSSEWFNVKIYVIPTKKRPCNVLFILNIANWGSNTCGLWISMCCFSWQRFEMARNYWVFSLVNQTQITNCNCHTSN